MERRKSGGEKPLLRLKDKESVKGVQTEKAFIVHHIVNRLLGDGGPFNPPFRQTEGGKSGYVFSRFWTKQFPSGAKHPDLKRIRKDILKDRRSGTVPKKMLYEEAYRRDPEVQEQLLQLTKTVLAMSQEHENFLDALDSRAEHLFIYPVKKGRVWKESKGRKFPVDEKPVYWVSLIGPEGIRIERAAFGTMEQLCRRLGEVYFKNSFGKQRMYYQNFVPVMKEAETDYGKRVHLQHGLLEWLRDWLKKDARIHIPRKTLDQWVENAKKASRFRKKRRSKRGD